MKNVLIFVGPILGLVLAGCAAGPGIRRSEAPATRVELAAHLIERLQLDKKLDVRVIVGDTGFKPASTVLSNPAKKVAIPDIADLRKKEQLDVEEIVELGVLELYPDGTFRPLENVTRLELAQTLQRILVYSLGDNFLATKFVGSESPFSDVDNSHFAFNAIMLATTRGLMKGTAKGTFDPTGSVSGAEILDALERLKPLL